MGYQLSKDVSDMTLQKAPDLVWDRIGPVKYDIAERLLESYLKLIPEVAKHIENIEVYLEKDFAAGKPFIRPGERPAVGNDVLNKVMKSVSLLDARLDRIEAKLKERQLVDN